MLIAARNAMMVGGGWKNPYVTDGLIAMWDGEWNAGGGKHDPNATRWVDLITGQSISPSVPERFSFVGNEGRFSQTDDTRCYIEETIPNLSSSLTQSGGITIESVSNIISWVGLSGYPVQSRVMCGGCYHAIQTGYSPCTFSGQGSWCVTNQPSYMPTGVIALQSTSVYPPVNTANTKIAWVNGEKDFLNYLYYNSTFSSTDYIRFGTAYKNEIVGLLCARFYSRALTADEIAANYAVDKARFNLP